MTKKEVEGMSADQKKKVCIAYLLRHIDECPTDQVRKMVQKLITYDSNIRAIRSEIEKLEAQIENLNTEGAQLVGAIRAIIDIAAELVPDDFDIDKACLAYDNTPANAGEQSLPPVKSNVDIAGSTARNIAKQA